MKPRFSPYRKAALLMGGVALAACSVFIPQKTDSIVFSHKVHGEQGMECDTCHAQVAKDAEGVVHALPKQSQCAECHEDDVKNNCKKCHTDVKAPTTWKAADEGTILFSHQLHLDRKTKCPDCHSGVTNVHAEATSKQRGPKHDQCKKCHKEDLEEGRCRLCHKRLDVYSRRPESLYSHPKGFFERHGKESVSSGQEHCAVCHDQSFCADCHARTMTIRPSLRFPEKVTSSFMHRGDWQGRHVIEARVSDATCVKCHGTSSCNACHERVGIGGRLGASPHKDQPGRKWAPESREAPDFNCNGDAFLHGRAARRRISECASCHDQGPASICVRCHHTGGGCKPHPPGYKPPVAVQNRGTHKMCSICHQ